MFDLKFEAYSKGPGFIASVVKEDKVIYQRGFGLTSLREVVNAFEINDSTIFNIASLSKQFTAIGILLLEQEGRVSSEDYIFKFIPEVPEYMRTIKIRHLLHHTAGLPDYMTPLTLSGQILNKDVLKVLFAKGKLNFPSGEKFEYSNSGYVLLSEIIQRITAKSFPCFIYDRLLKPLSMKDTFVFSDEKADRLAIGYEEWPYLTECVKSPYNYNFGDGGICTNMKDYRKWIHFLECPTSLIKPDFSCKIFKKGKTDLGEDIGYSYGWGFSKHLGNDFIAHTGTWLGYKSFVCFSPMLKMWLIIFSNYRGLSIERIASDFLDYFFIHEIVDQNNFKF